MNYFDKIPTILYNGRVAKNLVAKAQFSDQTRKDKFLYYPYSIPEATRADTLSNKYYDSPGYSWLIWMTNNVIDPYYDLPLDPVDFDRMIANKYKSTALAQRKIKCWRNNWYTDEIRLSVAQYSTLNPDYKKYYEPTLDSYFSVSGYKRKVDNSIVCSNVVAEIAVAGQYQVGEEVSTYTGYGFVDYCDGSYTMVSNVIGVIEAGQTLEGKQSLVSSPITAYTLVSNSIVFTDADYWTPVTYYEYEFDLNEGRKHIKLLDNRYKNQVETELKRVMEQ